MLSSAVNLKAFSRAAVWGAGILLALFWVSGPDPASVAVMEDVLGRYAADPALPVDDAEVTKIRALGEKGVQVLVETLEHSPDSQADPRFVLKSKWSAVAGFRMMGNAGESALDALADIAITTNCYPTFLSLAAIGDRGLEVLRKVAESRPGAQVASLMAINAGISWGNFSQQARDGVVPFLGAMLKSDGAGVPSQAAFVVAHLGKCSEGDLEVLRRHAQVTDNAVSMPAMVALISVLKEETENLVEGWSPAEASETRFNVLQAAWYCVESNGISRRFSPVWKEKLQQIVSKSMEDRDPRIRAWAVGHARNVPTADGQSAQRIDASDKPDVRLLASVVNVEALTVQEGAELHRWRVEFKVVEVLVTPTDPGLGVKTEDRVFVRIHSPIRDLGTSAKDAIGSRYLVIYQGDFAIDYQGDVKLERGR